MPTELRIEWSGRVAYGEALELQEKRVEALRQGAGPETLLLLEHPPVLTLGRRGEARHVLRSEQELRRDGIAVHRVSRGGDVTWHGPGQLVGYPILDLARRGTPDVSRYLRDLEAMLVEALGALGVPAHVRPGMTGVFAGPSAAEPGPPRKIASIGVGLRGWITWHGFALNVAPDLAGFAAIVPCGLHGVTMTSAAAELAASAAVGLGASASAELGAAATAALEEEARKAVIAAFRRRFAPERGPER